MGTQYKISNILREFTHEKNKWINLNSSQLSDIQDELFDIINNTYKPIGGHPDFKGSSDINMSDLNLWLSIDVDDDPEMDALIAGKSKPSGMKYTVAGTDGTSLAKRTMIGYISSKLKKKGNYIEASHKIAEILEARGVPVVMDKETIQRVINKPIKYLSNGWYIRKIGDQNIKKRLFGNPN